MKDPEFRRLWAKLLRMSGNPIEVTNESTDKMEKSLKRLKGISKKMRERLRSKIERKACEYAVQMMA